MITVAIVKEVNETELVATWTPSDIAVNVGDWIGVECKEQPAQEPVAIVYSMQDGYMGQMVVKDIPHKTKLYTHPAPSWQGLSDDEVEKIDDETILATEFARAIEQALKEKNHG